RLRELIPNVCVDRVCGAEHRSCAHLFFFQAEDGIRDLIVTGVQTCALPIFGPSIQEVVARDEAARARQPDEPRGSEAERDRPRISEERRVGKECRSRWGQDHYKKKKTAAEWHK